MQHMVQLPALYKADRTNGRRSTRRHFRHGVRAACLRAFTGAKLRRDENLTLDEAAARVGSNKAYIHAAAILLEANDADWNEKVMRGHIPILEAARTAEVFVRLVTAYKSATLGVLQRFYLATGATANFAQKFKDASAEARTDAAKRFGDAGAIWDQMVLPLIR